MDEVDVDLASMPDATLMNSAMDDPMVDLFGDEAADTLAASLPPVPLPSPVLMRITEMQARGCCTKLTWCKTGLIAQISPDGKRVNLRTTMRNKKTGLWELTQPSKHPIEAPLGKSFVHIQFNGLGQDLATVDDLGSIRLYSLAGPLGRMIPSHDAFPDELPRTELDAIVGLHWLLSFPLEFKVPLMGAAVKVGDKWEAQVKQREPQAERVHHPVDAKQAFVTISRSAKLNLCYQHDNTWQSVSTSLEAIASSREILSHAAVSEYGPYLIVATYDLALRLRVYRIAVNWNYALGKPGAAAASTMSPTLELGRLTMIESARAQSSADASLTHLRILPATPDTSLAGAQPPTIMAVFSHAPGPSDVLHGQGHFSVISRWNVTSMRPVLHEAFRKMKPGSDVPASVPDITALTRQPDIFLSGKLYISLDAKDFDTTILLGTSNGTLEFRDRATMNTIEHYGDTSQITSLSQSGFEHVPKDQHTHLAPSFDGSHLALVSTDGKLTTSAMTFHYGWDSLGDGLSDNGAVVEAGAICIARQYALLCLNNASSTDTLALLPVDASQQVRKTITRMIHRLLSHYIDIATQDPTRHIVLFRETYMPRSFGAQLVLATDPKTGKREFAAQYASAVLNLRFIFMVLAQSQQRRPAAPDNKQQQQQQQYSLTLDVALSLVGPLQWSIDMAVFLIDTLHSLKRDLPSHNNSITTALASLDDNPALQLLLSGYSRSWLRFFAQQITRFFEVVSSHLLPRATTAAEKARCQDILDIAARCPFKPSIFEWFITAVDDLIRTAYTSHATTPERRMEIELGLMCDGTIPEEFETPTKTLLGTILPKLLEKTDLGKLYFWDTSRLGIRNGDVRFDAARKTPLPMSIASAGEEGTAELRVCRRCGNRMEDIPPEKTRQNPLWLNQARTCFCLDYWVLV